MYVQALKAGLLYFTVVFIVAVALGAIRMLALAPNIGEPAAVLIETPFILAVSWFAADWLTLKFRVPRAIDPRLLMGAIALALLLLAELALSLLAFGRSIEEHFMAYLSAPGAIGLVAQLLYALIPAIQLRRWWGSVT